MADEVAELKARIQELEEEVTEMDETSKLLEAELEKELKEVTRQLKVERQKSQKLDRELAQTRVRMLLLV
eukprot:m.110904 g.110904  ORF g.110904 m.110904 type:complete len:70 (-) comp13411_c0_seq1:1064-1273(-)